MKKVSITELRRHTSQLLREVRSGEVIVIERRGQSVAELRPHSKGRKKPALPDMSDVWDTFPQVPGDSGRFLEEDR